MIDWREAGPLANEEIGNDEKLSHVLERQSEVSQGGKTKGKAKPSALIPYSGTALSVTREKGLSTDDVWSSCLATIEQKNSNKRKNLEKKGRLEEFSPLSLQGKATIDAHHFKNAKLSLEAAEPPRNHVDIAGWPSERSEQLSIVRDLYQHVETFLFAGLP